MNLDFSKNIQEQSQQVNIKKVAKSGKKKKTDRNWIRKPTAQSRQLQKSLAGLLGLRGLRRTWSARSAAGSRPPGWAGSPAFFENAFPKNGFFENLQIFGGLVLGCIKTKFCNKICVWQHFSSSTRFASFCTAAISNFSQKIGLKNCEFLKIFANFGKFY